MAASGSTARWKRAAAALVVVVACSVPIWLGLGTSDLQNDEAIYSYAVDRMVETGDWLTPRAIPFDNAFLEKPPLKFWIVAGLMRLGALPRDEAGMRAVDALFGSVIFLYVFLLGHRLGGTAGGVGAAAVLVTIGPLLFDHGLRSNNMDAATMAAYCGGVYHFARWVEGSSRARWAVAAWFVLGFMTKFVAALFLPLVCLLALAWRTGGWSAWRSRWREWVAPAVLIVVAVVPWFAWQTVRTGGGIWHIMLDEHVYERFTSGLDPHHLHPWSFYATRTWDELAAAGTLWLVLAGAAALARAAWRERPWLSRLVVIWGVVPLVLISGGSSKLFHYAYPFLPPFALGAGLLVSYAWRAIVEGPIGRTLERLPTSPLGWPRLPPAVRRPLQVACIAAALVAAGIAVATLSLGTLEWRPHGARVFSNAGVLRPLVVAAALTWLSGARRLVPGLVGVVAVALLLPLSAYHALLERTGEQPHPLRAIRDCAASVPGTPDEAVVFTPVQGLPHPYYYYLRHTGEWRWARPTAPAEVRLRASDPRGRTLLILTQHDYEAAASGWSELLRVSTAAGFGDGRTAGERPPVVPVSPYPGYVILLPGAYGACAGEVQAARGAIMRGSQRVEAGS